MTVAEPVTWTAPCKDGHDATWTATPNSDDGADYDCPECDAGTPPTPVLTGPEAWKWRAQLARTRRWFT